MAIERILIFTILTIAVLATLTYGTKWQLINSPHVVGSGHAQVCWEVEFNSKFVQCHTLDMSRPWSQHVVGDPKHCILNSFWTKEGEPIFVVNPHCMKETEQ